MQTQILRRNCDSPKCDNSIDLPVGNLRPEHERALGGWIVLTKEHVLVSGQPPQPMTKLGCSATCAVEIIKAGGLDIPKLPAIPQPGTPLYDQLRDKVPGAN